MLPPYPTLLRIGWRQYLNRFDLVLFGHLCFSLPAIVVVAYLKEGFPLPESITSTAALWPNFVIQLGLDQLAGMISCIVSILVVMGMRRAFQQRSTQFVAVLREAAPFYLPMMLLNLITLLLTVSGLVAFIVPGIFMAVLFTFAVPALAWHRLSVIQAIRHSAQLVRGQFWRVLFYSLMLQLLLTAVVLLITWGLPINFYFNIFATWITAVCASYVLVCVTIMMNATETFAMLASKQHQHTDTNIGDSKSPTENSETK